MKKLFFVMLQLCALNMSCKKGEENSSPKVINGEKVKDQEFDEVVNIAIKRDISGHCSGTFLTSSLLLTAAHCIVQKGKINTSETTVRLADGSVKANRMWAHPGYFKAPGPEVDVAIVEFPEGTSKKYANLSANLDNRGEFTAVGYGCNTESENSGYGVKRKGSIKVAERTAGLIAANANAEKGEATLCGGDSGGPLFVKGTKEIVGVNSLTFKLDAHVYGINFNDVVAESSQVFLGSLNKEGVRVPGIDPKYYEKKPAGLEETVFGKCVCKKISNLCFLLKDRLTISNSSLAPGDVCDRQTCEKRYAKEIKRCMEE